MAASHRQSEATSRGARMLRTALGPAIAGFLEDPQIVEVMLNPDGRLWVDRLSEGLADTGERLSPADGERIVRLVAHQSVWSRTMSAPRSMPVRRGSRLSCPRRESGSRACCRRWCSRRPSRSASSAVRAPSP